MRVCVTALRVGTAARVVFCEMGWWLLVGVLRRKRVARGTIAEE